MKMIHRGCGGEIDVDPSLPGYHYNPDTDTANEDDPVIPAYSCLKCGKEIYGDAQIFLEGYDDE